MQMHGAPLAGSGLGFRRGLVPALDASDLSTIDFFEIAPDNWVGVGGSLGHTLRRYTERHAFVCHGLSLSLGGPAPLDETFLERTRRFLDLHGIEVYSEHLSYTTDDGQLYDLMPIPFTEEAVDYVAERIRRTQDILGRRIAIENVSYYAAPGQEMAEAQFVREVLERADCELLLDVNNVHVNAVNHRYDALAYIDALPLERVRYLHVAGHFQEQDDLIVDTHASTVIEAVWTLLDAVYARIGPQPTLLERDFNFPPMAELLAEVQRIRNLQAAHADPHAARRNSAAAQRHAG